MGAAYDAYLEHLGPLGINISLEKSFVQCPRGPAPNTVLTKASTRGLKIVTGIAPCLGAVVGTDYPAIAFWADKRLSKDGFLFSVIASADEVPTQSALLV